MAVIATYTDNFDTGSKNTTNWSGTDRAIGHTALNGLTSTGTVSQTGGVLRMQPADSTTGFSGYASTDTNTDFTGGSMWCRVSTIDSNSYSSCNLIVAKTSNTNNRWFRASIIYSAGPDNNRINAQLFDGTGDSMSNLTYNSTDHRWIRIRISGSTWLFDTAPDGVDALTPGTWTNQFTSRTAVNGMEDPTGMEFGIQTWNDASTTGILWEVDQFNLSGSGVSGTSLSWIRA